MGLGCYGEGMVPPPPPLPQALTWAPAARRRAARSRPSAGDLLPFGIHAPAVPGAAVALQGPVPTLFVALGHVPVTRGRGSRRRCPWVQPLVLAGRQPLRAP